MKRPIDIRECGDIDLDRSAVIEASAGTGKTYTIERLIARILLEKKVPLEKILVVTFTEKATGEIKERVRKKLEDEIRGESVSAKEKELLRAALEGFDNASIFTIHGFCNRVLRQYAFENGEAFTRSQEDDTLLYEKVLKEQMRTSWRKWFGDKLSPLLRAAGFAGNEEWVSQVARLAGDYRPRCGDRIVPEAFGNPLDAFNNFVTELHKTAVALLMLVGPVDPADLEGNDFNVRYGNLGIQSKHLAPRRRDVILPLLRLLSEYGKKKELDIDAFSNFVKTSSDGKGYARLIDATMRKQGRYRELCPNLEAIVEALEAWNSLHKSLPALLKSSAIVRLKDEVAEYKRKRGLISYDDMIDQVDIALHSGDLLVEALRKRYAYALVDEFQDTDRVQWRIFRAVFSGSHEHRIFIIGDPKQAIYSFRGADVFAYIDAKKELLEKEKANYYSLTVNWRSTEPLINAYNRLFGAGQWFPDPDIEYLEVRAPAAARRRSRIYHDGTGRAAITAVDVDNAENTPEAHSMMSRFIADEIEKLLVRGGEDLVIEKGDGRGPGPLDPDDICVLVKAKKSAKLIQRYLDRKKIPYSFYKKSGLYSSDEAIHLRYFLEAIVCPSDGMALKKALLTPFFGIPLSEIDRYANLSPDSAIAELFQRWREYADDRRWPILFQSLLEHTGVSFKKDISERRLVNYQHILEKLGTEAISRNLDMVDIVALLNRYRKQDAFKDDVFDLHRLETEKPKVRFITIHSSKGMEFPVVFVADGYGQLDAGRADHWKYHDADNKIVYDLAKTDTAAFDRERARENRQLYYVALTRAKYKLYIPKFSPRPHVNGPLIYVVRAALERAWPGDVSDPTMLRFVDYRGDDLKKEPKLEVITDGKKPTAAKGGTKCDAVAPDPLFPDVSFTFEDRKIEIESYTHLKARMYRPSGQKETPDTSWIVYYDRETGGVKEEDDDDIAITGEDEDEASPAADGKTKAAHALPRGNVTGSMLHELMEAIDFAKAGALGSGDDLLKDAETEALIERKLRCYGMIKPRQGSGAGIDTEALKRVTAGIVWNTLNVQLPGGGFRLSRLTTGDKLHELEFYYPFPKPTIEKKLEGIKFRDGFLMGYIDLVFMFNDRYYILDWKSNYLDDGYSMEVMGNNIKESGYDLQYKVYSIAALRWLKNTVRDFDYDKHFGGIYYIYMRGVDASRTDQGAYFVPPTSEAAIDGYAAELVTLLNPSSGALAAEALVRDKRG